VIVYGKHRNLELAERHRRSLERDPGGQWEITARRNSQGHFSTRGHYFTFKSSGKTEYQINIKYKPNFGAKVEVQVSATGPAGQTKEQVLEAVNFYMGSGNNLPEWDVHIRIWEKYGRESNPDTSDTEHARNQLSLFMHDEKAVIRVDDEKVIPEQEEEE
jgi:hypothetical protein